MDRVKPLADVTPIWEDEEPYPVGIRVPMEDGRVITYRMDRDDAARQAFLESLAILKKWRAEDEKIGYKYRPKHAKGNRQVLAHLTATRKK